LPRREMVERKISEDNLRKLESIQGVINVEEDEAVSIDEALSRVLRFYERFVPYN
jgi:hypothetical protein